MEREAAANLPGNLKAGDAAGGWRVSGAIMEEHRISRFRAGMLEMDPLDPRRGVIPDPRSPIPQGFDFYIQEKTKVEIPTILASLQAT